jgi:hypothetical protein
MLNVGGYVGTPGGDKGDQISLIAMPPDYHSHSARRDSSNLISPSRALVQIYWKVGRFKPYQTEATSARRR